MQERRLKSTQIRTGKRATIWLSILVALGLHLVFLYLPWPAQTSIPASSEARVELQISKRTPAPVIPAPVVQQEKIPLPELEAEPDTVTTAEPVPDVKTETFEKIPENPPDAVVPERPLLTSQPFAPYVRTNFENMNEGQRRSLASSILTRQFIQEITVTEQLFGKPLTDAKPGHIAEFHYPARGNMMSMLDQSMPDLPFAYQEGLIHFAYDPGVKGDLQRFWDVITPEFGWRTKYGTEVRCIWVLVIAACGWK